MLDDPSNLDIAFEYAALSAQAGDLEGAISTLERMLIFAPGLPRLQLELGVLYFRLGAYETARAYFDGALGAPDVPDEVRQKVEPYLAAIDKQTAPSTFSGAVIAGARWQSNANAAPETRTVTLNGLDFLLSDSARGEPDYNGYVTANLLYSLDLQNQGDRLEARLLAYGALYAEHDEIDTGLAELTVGPRFDLKRYGIDDAWLGIYGIGSGVFLGDAPYLAAGGVGSAFTKLLSPSSRFATRGEYRREFFQDSGLRPHASDRSGDRFIGSAEIDHDLSSRFSIFAALEGERRFADHSYLSSWEVGASAGGTWDIGTAFSGEDGPWTLGISAGYLHREFDDPDPAIDMLHSEWDRETFVQGTLTIPVKSGWSLFTQAGDRFVDSNYDTRAFENRFGSVALVKQF